MDMICQFVTLFNILHILQLLKTEDNEHFTMYKNRFGLVHWDDPEGWYGEGGGGFRMGNTCTPVADSC